MDIPFLIFESIRMEDSAKGIRGLAHRRTETKGRNVRVGEPKYEERTQRGGNPTDQDRGYIIKGIGFEGKKNLKRGSGAWFREVGGKEVKGEKAQYGGN